MEVVMDSLSSLKMRNELTVLMVSIPVTWSTENRSAKLKFFIFDSLIQE